MSDTNSNDLVRDFLQKIVDHLPIALFCKDARHNFQYVFWNETAAKMWGFTTVEVVGQDDFVLFPKEAEAFRKKDQEAMTGREIVYIPQENVPTPSGTLVARTWKIPIYGEDGGPQWLLGISQDVSEPHLVESLSKHNAPRLVAVSANAVASKTPAAALAQEALTALEHGQIDLAKSLLESIQRLN